MTHRKNNFFTVFLIVILTMTFCLGGCLDDSSEPIAHNKDSHNHEQSVNAWIWVYQSDNKALNVYNAADGSLGASFTADVHSMMHIMQAGPASEPTLWMADGYTACSFTSGFHPMGIMPIWKIQNLIRQLLLVLNRRIWGCPQMKNLLPLPTMVMQPYQ